MAKLHRLLFLLLLFSAMPELMAATWYPQNPVSNQQIYCIADSTLRCFDRQKQTSLWQDESITSTRGMVLRNGQLFINTDHAALILNANDGHLIADILNQAALFDPVVTSNYLVLTDQQGWMQVIELQNRQTIWRRKIAESWIYPPAVYHNKLITGGRNGVLSALDPGSGKILWQRKIGQEIVYRPVSAGATIHVSSFDGYLYAIDPDSGEIISRSKLDSAVFEIKKLAEKVLIGAGYDGKLYAVDAISGSPLWNRQVADSLRFKFSVGDHVIASIDHAGHFNLIDGTTGRLIRQTTFDGHHRVAPLMTDSKIRLFPIKKPVITTLIR